MGVVACPNYEHDFDSCVFMKYVVINFCNYLVEFIFHEKLNSAMKDENAPSKLI